MGVTAEPIVLNRLPRQSKSMPRLPLLTPMKEPADEIEHRRRSLGTVDAEGRMYEGEVSSEEQIKILRE